MVSEKKYKFIHKKIFSILTSIFFLTALASAETVYVKAVNRYTNPCNDPEPIINSYAKELIRVLNSTDALGAEKITLELDDQNPYIPKDEILFFGDKENPPENRRIYYTKKESFIAHGFIVCLMDDQRFNNTTPYLLNGMSVGYNKNAPYQKIMLDNFRKEYSLKFKAVPIEYSDKLDNTITNNKVDACFASFITPSIRQGKVLYNFGNKKFYIASDKSRYVNMLNQAMTELEEKTPLYRADIITAVGKNYPHTQRNVSEQEYHYIQTHRDISVIDDDYYNSFFDKHLIHNENAKTEFYKKISGISGINFHTEKKSWNKRFSENCIFEASSTEKYHNEMGIDSSIFTEPFYNMNVRLILGGGKKLSDINHRTNFVVPKDMEKIISAMEQELGITISKENCRVEHNISTCLELVAEGKYDATFINDIYLQQTFKIGEYKNLNNAFTNLYEIPMCLGVNYDNPEILVSILNRSLAQFSSAYYSNLLAGQGIYSIAEFSSERKLRRDLNLGLIILAFILITVAVATTVHINKKRKDSLTSLYSLSGFEEHAIKLLKKYPNSDFLLTEINIRAFSNINKNHGENKGNKILTDLSNLIEKKCLPGAPTVIARGYADSFCVFERIDSPSFYTEKKELNEEAIIEAIKNSVRQLQNQLTECQNNELSIILKSGSAIYRGSRNQEKGTKDFELNIIHGLMGNAKYARRSTRTSIVNNTTLYNSRLQEKHEKANRIESQIIKAVQKKEFKVMYQPKYELSTGKIKGAEALVRWIKDGKIISPEDFIPLLEKNDYIKELNKYIYEEVYKFQNRILEAKNDRAVPVSINISRVDYDINLFISELEELEKRFSIPKELIELEIEERESSENSFNEYFIKKLSDKGWRISIDDFGSGQSSLRMLSEVPVDIIKIDQGFLRTIEFSENSKLVLKHMIHLINSMGKVSLCEGVENEMHVQILKEFGCQLAQGYFYSKPVDADVFMKMLWEQEN